MAERVYYVNDEFVPASHAALPLNDLGIVRGYGVFDLLRTYGYTPFRLQEHLARLESSAAQIGLTLPWSRARLTAIVKETYARNHLPDASIRIIVTGGPSKSMMMPDGDPSLVVMVQPISPYPTSYYTDGTKATTTVVERIMPTVKSLNYIGAIIAMQQAGPLGAVEAIYLDRHGQLTEGTRANLFVVRDGRLITPGAGILPGITRQAVIQAATQEFVVEEAPIHHHDLATVAEAFLTSTTKEVLPVAQIDDLIIGSGKPGPVTQRVMTLFRALTEAETAAAVA